MNKLLTAAPLAAFTVATLAGGFVATMGPASADPQWDHHEHGYYNNYRRDDRRDYHYQQRREWVTAHWEDRGHGRVWVPGYWATININL